MTRLACNSLAAVPFSQSEGEVFRRITSATGAAVFPTKRNREGAVDGFAVQGGVIEAVLEIKSRNLTRETLERYGTYLVTREKIVDLCHASRLTVAKGVLFVHLIPDDAIMYWNVCDDTGLLTVDFEVKETLTWETCERLRKVMRPNAFIPVTLGKTLKT